MSRELTIAVAVKVMGWHFVYWEGVNGYVHMGNPMEQRLIGPSGWNPCKSIAAAWEVVERMHELGLRYVLCRGYWAGKQEHGAAFDYDDVADPNSLYQSGPCATLPEAICKAALLAVAGMKDNDD